MNTVPEIEAAAKQRMEKALTDLQSAMAAIRTGRASIHLLDAIRVDYYGTPTPLNQVANLHVPEPGMITVQPWDASLLAAIEKTIRTSDLGINPANDGKIIRLPIPPLTEERRKELVKKLHASRKIIASRFATFAAIAMSTSSVFRKTRKSPKTTTARATTKLRS